MYEQKFAVTDANLAQLIRERWSPRSFTDRQISDSDLKAVLEAARWAASSSNEQPWRYVIGRRGTPAFDKLLQLLVPQNQVWAKKASVLMITAARKNAANGKANYYHLHDLGAANAHILLQASALGFAGHEMGGFDHERAAQELHFPSDYVPGSAIALGYIAPPEELEMEERYRDAEKSPRKRLDLKELVFDGDFGQALYQD